MPISSPQLIFRSSKFEIEPNEDCDTNPGIFGRSLANWIGSELLPDFSPELVIAEDFGWLVPIPHSKHRMYVACSSTGESASEWRAFVFVEGGLVARLLGGDGRAESARELFERLKGVLEAQSEITVLREED